MSTFPYSQTTLLNNSVHAETTVSLVDGMQVSKTIFQTAAGSLGSVTLSPENTTKSGINLQQSTQQLHISNIHFQAAFGLVDGKVIAVGWSTDQEGSGHDQFSKEIANWTAS
ncbi:MAG: hypothetical protein F6K31_35110 [Symploca sp. SIO2G7]|nr:hypothetical protein [Symploca sp. SIO2G7]